MSADSPLLTDDSRYGWIGVDLDGTLARYEPGTPYEPGVIGEPIPAMLERVQRWLADRKDVRIFTARVSTDGTPQRDADVKEARAAIAGWCLRHLHCILAITNIKDFRMLELWDDRAVQVEPNTGAIIGKSTRGLE